MFVQTVRLLIEFASCEKERKINIYIYRERESEREIEREGERESKR